MLSLYPDLQRGQSFNPRTPTMPCHKQLKIFPISRFDAFNAFITTKHSDGPTCRARYNLMNIMLYVAFDFIKDVLVSPDNISTDRSPQLVSCLLTTLTALFELQITELFQFLSPFACLICPILPKRASSQVLFVACLPSCNLLSLAL